MWYTTRERVNQRESEREIGTTTTFEKYDNNNYTQHFPKISKVFQELTNFSSHRTNFYAFNSFQIHKIEEASKRDRERERVLTCM